MPVAQHYISVSSLLAQRHLCYLQRIDTILQLHYAANDTFCHVATTIGSWNSLRLYRRRTSPTTESCGFTLLPSTHRPATESCGFTLLPSTHRPATESCGSYYPQVGPQPIAYANLPKPQQYNTYQHTQTQLHQNVQHNFQQPYVQTLNPQQYAFGNPNSHPRPPTSSQHQYSEQTNSYQISPQQVSYSNIQQSIQPSNPLQFGPNVQQYHLNSRQLLPRFTQQQRPQKPIPTPYPLGPNVTPQPANTIPLVQQSLNQQPAPLLPKDLQDLLLNIKGENKEFVLPEIKPEWRLDQKPPAYANPPNPQPIQQPDTLLHQDLRDIFSKIEAQYKSWLSLEKAINTRNLDFFRNRQSPNEKNENENKPEWLPKEQPPHWVRLVEKSYLDTRVILYNDVVAAIERRNLYHELLLSGYVRENGENVPEALVGVIHQYMRDLGEDTDGKLNAAHASISKRGLFALYWEKNKIIALSKYRSKNSYVTWEVTDQNNHIILPKRQPFEKQEQRSMGKNGRMRLTKGIMCCDDRFKNATFKIHFCLKMKTMEFEYTDSATIPPRADHQHHSQDCSYSKLYRK
eukprot:954089_1